MRIDDKPEDRGALVNLRYLTPILISISMLMTTILIAVVSNLTTEIRAVRVEVAESRKFAVQYTDKMIELLLKTDSKKR